jgi:hypothetical protein
MFLNFNQYPTCGNFMYKLFENQFLECVANPNNKRTFWKKHRFLKTAIIVKIILINNDKVCK